MKLKILAVSVVLGLVVAGVTLGISSTLQKPSPHAKPIVKEWTKSDSRKLAKTIVAVGWGWRGSEWRCLERLWDRESRWDYTARNPKSSAYGIAQLLGEKSKVPSIQILRGARYVLHRHGSPCNAWRFFRARNWY